VRQAPDDIMEWIDLVLLSFDGALRQGFTPEQVAQALDDKLTTNVFREWPNWRDADPNKAIKHTPENTHD